MSSTATLKNANQLVAKRDEFLTTLIDDTNLRVLRYLKASGPASALEIASNLKLAKLKTKRIVSELEHRGLIIRRGDSFALTLPAQKRLSYATVSLDFLVDSTLTADSRTVPHALGNTYVLRERIGKGATSFTFRAEQSGTHRDRTLKVFLPNTVTYEQLDAALEKRNKIRQHVALPEIIEAGQVTLLFPDGRSRQVPCLALEYIDSNAKTFAEFLKAQDNLNPAIFERFIERVGGALAAIEEVGLHHGDLHEGNILVVPGASAEVAHDFWVIDFVGVPSATSPELDLPSDIESFRDHLLRAAIIAAERYPGYSARFLLGSRSFRVLQVLREGNYETFRDMLDDFHRTHIPIPDDYFRPPRPEPFEWLRVESIPSSAWLYKLFEPVPSRLETISRFGNTWISGPRGCGKSHYLRVLAFQPSVLIEASDDQVLAQKLEEIKYNFRRSFGVLFACRLGEFKGFTPEALGQEIFDTKTITFLKHIIVLKIWNKTLDSLREGLESSSRNGKPLLEMPNDVQRIRDFLQAKIGRIAVVSDSLNMSIFRQCLAACTARENSAIAVWNQPSRRRGIRMLDERDLDEFFLLIKQTFGELNQTRFLILVDDASYGHIHFEMQKVLNSLIRAAQANHCFKITCDKFMYTLDTADGRAIDPRHEVTYVDLGEVSTKAQRETAVDLAKYTAQVVNTRLKAGGFESSIEVMLGQSQNPREFLSALSLPGARRRKRGESPSKRPPRPKAYYAGWNIVWSISHGSVRTLLELVEYIFRTNKVSPRTVNISLKAQDSAARSYSNRHFKALSMLPGELEGEPIGQGLQAVISAIGEMSRQYLEHYHTGEEYRWYETISIERLDRNRLLPKAQRILDELVKYGLLLDEGITFSRAQFGLCQRYDMNKVFAPAFETTYRVRNHIYLSRARLEELLLQPDVFVARHRKKLKELAQRKAIEHQTNLFGDDCG